MKYATAFVILILSGFSAFATVYQSDGSAINVQLIHDMQATDGDTITIPTGSFTWTTTVTISKGITLQGAGLSASHITDQGLGGAALIVTCTAAHFVRVTGLEFIKSTAHPSGMVQFYGTNSGGNNEVGFRFDHCKLNFPTTGGRGVYATGIFGVIDHNNVVVSGPGSQQSISVDGSSVGSDGGFTPWTRPLTLGTDKAVYIEDNTFDYTANDQAEDSVDAYAGARIVVRHNTFLSITQGFHGTDSGGNRSPHSFEIYSNTYINNSSTTLRALTVRGGTGVIWGNTYGGSHGSWNGITLQYYRAYSSQSGWQQCNGTLWQLGSTDLASEGSRTCSVNGGVGFNNVDKETLGPWGGNYTTGFDGTGLLGYPGRDQPGFTTGQVSSPIYIWNQTPDLGAGTWAGGDPDDEALLATFIVQGRNWFNNIPKPGYTPYTYPHPLVIGGSPSPTPTPAATPTATATIPPSPTPTATFTPTPTATAKFTPTPTATVPPSPTSTPTPTATSTPPPSNIYYVDNSGSPACSDVPSFGTETHPWCTVQYGVGRITGGATLYVKNGTYNEAFTIHGPAGTSAAHTIISAYPGHAPILRGSGFGSGRMKITGTSYIDFSGFIITNDNQGLYIDDDAGTGTPPDHITVTDVTVHDVGQEGIAIRGDTTNILLNRVTVYNTGRNGTSSNGEGIYIGGGNAPDNTNAVTVQNSVIHDTQDEGIELKPGTHDCIVEGNTLYNNLAPGSSHSSGGGAIEINNPSGNYGSNPNHVIRGNIIRDIGFTSGITKYGIRAGTGAKVYNNVLYNINSNYNAVQCNDANDYPRIIYHNTVDAASNRAVVNSGTTMDSKNNIGPATTNNLAILPSMFVNYASHDYHLVADSLARNVGLDLRSIVPTDFDGNPRDATPDLGAFEYVASGTPSPSPTPTPTPTATIPT